MKKPRIFLAAVTLTLLLCGICNAQNVKVKIAPFYTQIEDVSVDNRYVQYPLITYKDITYFPMTYNLCSMLGLSTGFDSKDGLYITKHHSSVGGSNLFGGDAVNYYNTEYNAVIPTYPVYLNGIRIDNSKEEYPLINFRDITYFPMTWRFAYEELNFNIKWSQEDYSFYLERNSSPSLAYVYKSTGDSLFFENKVDVYDKKINEYGDFSYQLMYSYWKFYELNLTNEMLARLDSRQSGEKDEFDRAFGREEAQKLDVVAKEKGLYLGEKLIMECNTENMSDIQAFEYKTGENSSIITLVVFMGQNMPPYTQHSEYVIERIGDSFTKLDWDVNNNFSGIFTDNNGGRFICSSGYSPIGSGRWSNPFSDIYYYKTGSGVLESYAEKYSDKINSAAAIGKANGKLYVKAVRYEAKKDSMGIIDFNIAPVNSGFYEIDLENGQMSKIYPYIEGETFIAPNGAVYCSTGYARKQRLVNLVTGKIIPVE